MDLFLPKNRSIKLQTFLLQTAKVKISHAIPFNQKLKWLTTKRTLLYNLEDILPLKFNFCVGCCIRESKVFLFLLYVFIQWYQFILVFFTKKVMKYTDFFLQDNLVYFYYVLLTFWKVTSLFLSSFISFLRIQVPCLFSVFRFELPRNSLYTLIR